MANQTVHGDEALLKQLEELFGERKRKADVVSQTIERKPVSIKIKWFYGF
ncbi:MAG: hypothetical protein ACLURV_06665 [Gallintestinimicrobium sp.]